MSKAAPLASDRSFGLAFVVVVFLVAAWAAWTNRIVIAIPCAALSAFTLIAALLRPSLLHPLNRAWMKLGAALHVVVNPIVLGAIYFNVIVPIGIVMRLGRPRRAATAPAPKNAKLLDRAYAARSATRFAVPRSRPSLYTLF